MVAQLSGTYLMNKTQRLGLVVNFLSNDVVTTPFREVRFQISYSHTLL